MARFSLFVVAVSILFRVGAAELNHSFSVKLVTAGQGNATECSLIEMMELNLRLASSFQSSGRKFYHQRVVLQNFTQVTDAEEQGNDDDGGGRELLVTNQTSLTNAKISDIPTHGMLRGQSSHERHLGLIYKIYSGSGAYTCRLCPSDNRDRRQLSNTMRLNSLMSKYMTKDIKAYIISKGLNKTTTSCFGDGESIYVDFTVPE